MFDFKNLINVKIEKRMKKEQDKRLEYIVSEIIYKLKYCLKRGLEPKMVFVSYEIYYAILGSYYSIFPIPNGELKLYGYVLKPVDGLDDFYIGV